MPEYKWGILLAPKVEGRTVGFGQHRGEPAWQEVPGEYRGMLRRLITIQGDTEPASVEQQDRKSTRLNSSHANISYAVFCLKKKTLDSVQTRSIPSRWMTIFFTPRAPPPIQRPHPRPSTPPTTNSPMVGCTSTKHSLTPAPA